MPCPTLNSRTDDNDFCVAEPRIIKQMSKSLHWFSRYVTCSGHSSALVSFSSSGSWFLRCARTGLLTASGLADLLPLPPQGFSSAIPSSLEVLPPDISRAHPSLPSSQSPAFVTRFKITAGPPTLPTFLTTFLFLHSIYYLLTGHILRIFICLTEVECKLHDGRAFGRFCSWLLHWPIELWPLQSKHRIGIKWTDEDHL